MFLHAQHVAVFDTSFHQTLSPYAYLYGLPYEYAKKRMIAREILRILERSFISSLIKKPDQPAVPIEASAHHVHLCQEHVEILFGPGHALTPQGSPSQLGQYACVERPSI